MEASLKFYILDLLVKKKDTRRDLAYEISFMASIFFWDYANFIVII